MTQGCSASGRPVEIGDEYFGSLHPAPRSHLAAHGGLLLAGALAYRMLPVAPLPEVEYPVIQVSANLPGASPDTMASAVATPLERMFGRIAGITQMTSTSQLGSTNIVLQFDLNRDIDAAARDVQAAINAARGQLPANLPTNPTWRKVNPAESRRSWFWRSLRTPPRSRRCTTWPTPSWRRRLRRCRRRAGHVGRQFAARRCAWRSIRCS